MDIHNNGFWRTYKNWIFHGESLSVPPCIINQNFSYNVEANAVNGGNEEVEDELETLLGEFIDAQEYYSSCEWDGKNFERLLIDAQQELYQGCEKYSLLHFFVNILNVKVINYMTNKAFNMMFELFKDMVLASEIVPSSDIKYIII